MRKGSVRRAAAVGCFALSGAMTAWAQQTAPGAPPIVEPGPSASAPVAAPTDSALPAAVSVQPVVPPPTSAPPTSAAPAALPPQGGAAQVGPLPPQGAAPAEQPPEPTISRHLALGFGTATGLGLIAASLRGRLNYVALEGAAGYAPILLMSSGDSRCSAIVFEVPLQVTGSMIFFFANDQKRFVPGLRVAAVYNSKLDMGAMLGFESELRVHPLLSLGIGAGLKVHPKGNTWAKDRLKEEVGKNCQVQSDPMNVVFPYINFQVLFYPI